MGNKVCKNPAHRDAYREYRIRCIQLRDYRKLELMLKSDLCNDYRCTESSFDLTPAVRNRQDALRAVRLHMKALAIELGILKRELRRFSRGSR